MAANRVSGVHYQLVGQRTEQRNESRGGMWNRYRFLVDGIGLVWVFPWQAVLFARMISRLSSGVEQRTRNA